MPRDSDHTASRARTGRRGQRIVLILLMTVAACVWAWPPSFSMAPAAVRADAPPPLVFAVIGDFGTASPHEQDVATLVAGWNPAFVVTTGDNNYPTGAAATIDQNIGQYYRAFIAPYVGTYGAGAETNRFFPVLGNHDWVTDSASAYLAYFSLPGNERYYSVVQGPVHLFAVDSDPHEPDGVGSTSTQATWLRDQLAASTACWKLVAFHHAAYSSGQHGSSAWMQWPFRTWGAHAVFSGHDHIYERLSVDGLPYMVNGLGGTSRYAFGTTVAGSIVRYNAGYGAMRVTATDTTITYEFVGTDGTIVDSYSETGGCGPATPPTPTATATDVPTPTPTPAATATAVPTATLTSPPTPTPTSTLMPPAACNPRPAVQVSATPNGPGQLQVTVAAAAGGSQIRTLRFGGASNAQISAPGGPSNAAGAFTVSLSPWASLYSFTVHRTTAGQPVQVPFVVVDACGDWATFVGGGPAAF